MKAFFIFVFCFPLIAKNAFAMSCGGTEPIPVSALVDRFEYIFKGTITQITQKESDNGWQYCEAKLTPTHILKGAKKSEIIMLFETYPTQVKCGDGYYKIYQNHFLMGNLNPQGKFYVPEYCEPHYSPAQIFSYFLQGTNPLLLSVGCEMKIRWYYDALVFVNDTELEEVCKSSIELYNQRIAKPK